MSTISVDEEILRLEVTMDDTSGVAKVDAIDQLKHDQANLLLRNGVFVLREVLLEVMLSILEDQVQLLLVGKVKHVEKTE